MIQVDNVTKIYRTRTGPRLVLDGVNLAVHKGEHVGIMGRNGAGKSTLIRLIGGGEKPTQGVVRRRMSVSWPIAFSGAFQPGLTGLDNLRFVCRIYGINAADVLPFIEDFSELGVYMREPISHYSSGMVARLAFAISLAIEFECFLIDEVIAVGDGRFHEKCRIELFEKRKDRAFIIVSHHKDVIREQCHRAAVLEHGKLKPFDNVVDAMSYYDATVTT
jgi:capsular polysaccharide transport system ATP-binding protein